MQPRAAVARRNARGLADQLYYHYYDYPIWRKVRPHYGVVTERHKLVHYYKPDLDEWERCGLQANAAETKNFIADPAYAQTVAELKKELARLRTELKLPPPDEEPRHAYGRAPFAAPGRTPGAGKVKNK